MTKGKTDRAADFILQWGGFDGAHHKQWALDQALRILLGHRYELAIEEHNEQRDEDGESYMPWDVGIAP